MDEQDLRLALLNTLLTTPHRTLTAIYPLHKQTIAQDPHFLCPSGILVRRSQ